MWYCILQSLLFKVFSLNSRLLQERGMSSWGILKIQRYAIVPCVFFCLLCSNASDWHLLIHSHKWHFLVFISIAWVIASFTGFFLLNSTNSLSYLSAITAFMNIPMVIISAKLLNGETPNLMSGVGLIFLVIAIIIEPTVHESNERSKFSYPVYVIFIASIINSLLGCLEGGLYRNFMPSFKNELFPISVYMLTVIAMLNIVCVFIPTSASENKLSQNYKIIAISIPLFWFIASIKVRTAGEFI